MKTFFIIKDNLLDKKILAYLDSKEFSRKKHVNRYMKKIIVFYAENFENNNMNKARFALEKKDVEMRRKDLIMISVFSGALGILSIITIMVLLIPGVEDPWEDWLEIFNNFYAFRFLFMIIFLLFFTAVDIYILRRFKVNYLFIFELDPHYKVTHIQLLRVILIKFNFNRYQ